MEIQSVLVILVPEAEPVVGSFRSRYDSSAKDGMPAHITVNCPFRSIETDRVGAVSGLQDLFASYPLFDFSLTTIRRFPGVIYLEPNPIRPFSELIQAVADRFPDSPPYGGTFDEIIPHLTVAVADDADIIEQIAGQFSDSCEGKLPIPSVAREVWLFDNKPGVWTRRRSFPLSGDY